MSRRKTLFIAILGIVLVVGGWLATQALVSDAFEPRSNPGPFQADGACPTFRARYPSCKVKFGNSGLSTINSFYESFVGEGTFDIRGFTVETLGANRFNITAVSNRGPITSQIHADRLVRLGQEKENEKVNRTHQSAYCHQGRIYEHQVGYAGDSSYVQDLEFWEEEGAIRFRLFQGGSATADVTCRAQ